MNVPSRSRRRHDRWRMRQRMLRYYSWSESAWFRRRQKPVSPQWLGIMLSTHGKPCSCWGGCGNRRRRGDGPSLGERRQIADATDQIVATFGPDPERTSSPSDDSYDEPFA